MLICLSPVFHARLRKLSPLFRLFSVCTFILTPLLLATCLVDKLEAATFARDSQTELTIDPPGSAGASSDFSFTRYADASPDEDFYFGGTLKLDGSVYRMEEQPDQKSNTKIAIEGDLDSQQLEVKASGLTDQRKKSYDLSGTYRKLSNEELQQRAQRRYDEADSWLNEIYGQAKKKLTAGSFADLKKREGAWIQYRDDFADHSGEIAENTESRPKEVARLESLRDLTMSRIKFIRSLLDDSLPAGISAVYNDEYGGELDLEKDSKGIKFSLNVVRGPTLHVGDVSGRIILKGRSGSYRDPDPLEGQPPAEISFSFLDDRRVEIKARNDTYLRGARAYFDGVYFKSGPLTKPIELE